MDNYKSGKFLKSSTNNSNLHTWNFASEPALHPMKVTVKVNKPGTAPGYLFVAPYTLYGETMIGQQGALIMDHTGNPVWFRPVDSDYTIRDFKVQSFHGSPVLTLWQGRISGTTSTNPILPVGDPKPGAYFLIINQNYQIIKTITAQKGYTADDHEFMITKRNTALFISIKLVFTDLSPFGGPKEGYIDNYAIQEVDLVTGELLFFWDALSHVDPGDSMVPASSATNTNNIWDCFHINSIEEGPDNTLLISMRDMWAIYNIDKDSGSIIWQLGGKQSDFNFGPEAAFSWQHDARYQPGNRISLFDNACCASSGSAPESASHGLILQLDYQHMTAKAVQMYFHNPALFVSHQGNMQKLPNGNQFIGWGMKPYLSEFKNAGNTIENPSLNLIYDVQYPGGNFSYRAFKYEWVGLPLYPPSIAVHQRNKDSVIVYASWNGSTETAFFRVLAGQTLHTLSVVIPSIPHTGFETAIPVQAIGPYFQVIALTSDGKIIGASRIASLYKQQF